MLASFADVCCASLPPDLLGALAPLRATAGVKLLGDGQRLWLRWPPGDERVLRLVLPLPGTVLYAWRDGWFRLGARLPAFDVPSGDFQPLHNLLVPAPASPLPVSDRAWRREEVRLVIDTVAKATAGLLVAARDLLPWADAAPTAQLRRFRAALCDGEILLLGKGLPLLPGARRFWGDQVLRPLGRRLEPDLPESALREALDTPADDLLVFDEDGAEIIPASSLRPLSRAGIRLSG